MLHKLRGHQDPVVRLALLRPQPGAAGGAVAALAAVLINNVQRIGPTSAVGASVFFDSAPFALKPSVPTGAPAVEVTGSASVLADNQSAVTFQLVRDRGTAGEVVLTEQEISPVGGEGGGIVDTTLDFLDTVDTVDAITGAPFPLGELSTHTYSIRVIASLGTVTGSDNTLVLLKQQLGGHSTTVGAPPLGGVNLGTAADFASFGSAGISTTPGSHIVGDLGTPSTASSITGFGLVLDGSGQFSTSAMVVGDVYAHDYAVPTPAKVTLANVDMLAAYTDASTRVPGFTDLFAGHLGGQTLVPGTYKWTTPVEIGAAPAGPLTLNGLGIYILQVAGTFDLFSDIVLEGGALPENVFVAVAGAVTLHPASIFRGELLGATSIATQAGALVEGRLLAQTGVTLISTTIDET